MSELLVLAVIIAVGMILSKMAKRIWAQRWRLGPKWKLKKLLREKEAEIKAAEDLVRRWESDTGAPLTKLESVWLYERALTVNGEFIPLENVRAEALSAGEVAVTSSPTLTRAAIGGCLFGWPGAFLSLFLPKKRVDDSRRPLMRLWVGDYERIISFKPYHDRVVFELAAMINNAAIDAPSLELHRQQYVREAKLDLMKIRADTPEIAQLRAQVAAKKRGKMNHQPPGGMDGSHDTN